MSTKIGRPKVDSPKNIRYSIRLDGETEQQLIDYCSTHNITKGEAIRQGIHLLLNKKKQQSIPPAKDLQIAIVEITLTQNSITCQSNPFNYRKELYYEQFSQEMFNIGYSRSC